MKLTFYSYSRRVVSTALLPLFLSALLLVGCGNTSPTAEAEVPAADSSVSAATESEPAQEAEIVLPEEFFTKDTGKELLIAAVKDGKTDADLDVRMEVPLGEEEIAACLDCYPTGDLYTDYATETYSFDFSAETVKDTPVLHLSVHVTLRPEAVPYENVFFPGDYHELYDIYLNHFRTGFEQLVIMIPGDWNEDWVQYLVEEAAWHNSLNMPLLYKATKPAKLYADDRSSYLMVLSLDYESYGITEEMQLEAQILVREKVHEMAEEIRATSDDPREQTGLVYDAVTKQVAFDYNVGDLLLEVETRDDQIIGVGRGIYGAAVTGKSVCTGYAALFHEICKELGIPSAILVGYAENGDHAWNMVLLDGKTEYLDPTWGDSKKWYKTYKFFSEDVNNSEFRRVYDYEVYPQEFYDGGFDLPTAPMCLYD